MSVYTGGCHCGLVRYEVETDLAQIIECNCSYCTAKGLLLNFVPVEKFKLISGEESLGEYLFNKKVIHHVFCKVCGTQSFANAVVSGDKKMIAINVRCLEGVNLKELALTPYDGKSR